MPRRPTPTALKLLAGNPGNRPLPANEPQPEAMTGAEEPPAILDAEARKYWPEIARQLAEVGVLSVMDKPMLWLLVEAMAEYIKAREAVKTHGDTVNTVAGGEQVSPWMRMKWKSREHLYRMLIEFGMSPASRARVHADLNIAKKANKFGALRGGRSAAVTHEG